MTKGKIKLSDLQANPENPRTITDEKFEELKRSLQDFPKMMELRPVVVDEQGVVLGGNMRLKALVELGYKEVPSDWVKRADELTEDEKAEFIIKDNLPFGVWDWDKLANEWNLDELNEWGLEVPDVGSETEYTTKVDAPTYEPINEKPNIADLIDKERYVEMIKEIDASKCSDDEKEFLRAAAARHLVFNYSYVADYYAHSNKEVQNLMERSGLVIIDFKRAIEEGFVELAGRLHAIQESDYEGR